MISPTLQALLDTLPEGDRITFVALADALYKVRFTGVTGIHWLNGLPRQIDLGTPIRLTIVEGLDKPTRPDRS